MAHNLATTNGKIAFASAIEKAWHGLGTITEGLMTAEEALEKGGQNYEVVKSPILYDFKGQLMTNEEKVNIIRDDSGDALGVVGKNYEIMQNRDAFKFFDAIVDQGAAIYETAGALGKGEKTFITAKMKSVVGLTLNGVKDETELYMVVTNSHDGTGAIVAGLTPVRIVCQNTLNIAMGNMTTRVKIRHTKNLNERLADAARVMGMYNESLDIYRNGFETLAKINVSDAVAKEIIDAIFNTKGNENTRINNIKDNVFEAYQTGVGQSHTLGTAWGVYNGITNYLSHKDYKNEDVKFSNLMDGEAYKQSVNAFNLLMKLA